MSKIRAARVEVPSQCGVCDGNLQLGGPIWSDPLHCADFVQECLELIDDKWPRPKQSKMQDVLSVILNELKFNTLPLGYSKSQIFSDVRSPLPDYFTIQAALNSLRHVCSKSFCSPKLIKTSAPPEVVYDMVKNYKFQKDVGMSNIDNDTSIAHKILSKPIKHTCGFDYPTESIMRRMRKQTKQLKGLTPDK